MKKKLLTLVIMASICTFRGILLQIILFNLAFADNLVAQKPKSVDQVFITLNLTDASIQQAFRRIESKTEFRFAFERKDLDPGIKLNIDAQNSTVKDVLLDISKNAGLHFQQVNYDIDVFKKRSETSEGDRGSVAVIFEDVQITGRVTSTEDGNGLPGVNILVKGTNIGAITDVDGYYSIEVPDQNATIVFSFIGFLSKEVTVGSQTQINIALEPDVLSLEEIVVVGYGTQIKKDVTGSVASIKSRDIENIVVTSADALLQGKAAGVQVVQNSGAPGGEIFVRVRGSSSLRADTRPLYVIDGVPMNNNTNANLEAGGQQLSALADINPSDIESMEILKDAAATAIYGARGSNGVVLITTKRGKSGKATFGFDAYYGVQEVWKTLDMVGGDEYLNILRESRTNRGLSNDVFPYNELEATGINTDWQDEIFRTAPISSYNFSINGGSEKVKTYASLGFFNQEGTIIGQDYSRITGRLNLDYDATDRVKFGVSMTYSDSENDRVANDFSGISVLANALLRNPNLPVRNPDGTYNEDPLGQNGTENPVMLANEVTFETAQRRLISNLYAQIDIIKGLTFKSSFGFDFLAERTRNFEPSFVLRREGRARANSIFIDDFTWVNDNTLSYATTFNDGHRLSALVGLGIQKNRRTFLRAGGETAGSDIITTIAVANPFIPGNSISEWTLLSYFGRFNYSFRDKYLVEGSFRVDGSSRFGEDNRYGFFPGISVGWRVAEEAFMEDIRPISDLKLRFGIGETGNQEGIGNFQSATLYGTGRNYDGQPGISQSQVPNPSLSWESTLTTNVGVDIAFFENRVNLSVDAYLKETRDLIFTRQLPWTSGFNQLNNENVGSMENRGLEFSISTNNLTGEFKWTTDFNVSINRNEITSLPENGVAGSDLIFQLPSAYDKEGPYSIYRVGEPVGSFYGFIYQGVYPTDEAVPANLKDDANNPQNNYRGGFPIFVDADGNGQYDRQLDRFIIGNALPRSTGGMTNTFSYKNFELNVFINWSQGNDIYNVTRGVLTGMTGDFNQSTEVLNRWRNPGDVTDVPLALFGASSIQGVSVTDASSRYIEDGSFLRIRNVTLSYSLPAAVLERLSLSSARIYFTGQNLYTFTDYSGMDPENQNTGNNNLLPTLGVDYLTQPQPRVYMVGVNLKF